MTYNERKEALARLQSTDADYMAVKGNDVVIENMQSTVENREALNNFKTRKQMDRRNREACVKMRESLVIRTFNKFLGESYIQSLNIEDKMKVRARAGLLMAVNERLDGLMGGNPDISKLRKLVKESTLLEGALTEAEYQVSKLMEGKTPEEVESLEISDEELPDIAGDTADEISDAVKSKVVEVIKSEQEDAEKNKAEMEEIIASSKPVAEGTQNLFMKSPLQNRVKENYSLFRGMAINVAREAIKENSTGFVVNDTVQMDMVITETIVRYTLLEFFSTIRLENHSAHELREMAMTLAKG